MKKLWVVLAILMVVVPAVAGASVPEDPEALQAVKTMSAPSGFDADTPYKALRPQAIQEAAMTVGVQSGVRWRYGQIIAHLLTNHKSVDQVFDFSPLLLNDGRVLPPVIVDAHDVYHLESSTRATSTQAAYRIIQRAQLATIPPNWRDYLLRDFESVTEVNPIVLPKNDAERALWESAAEEGWSVGVAQANRVFNANLDRLVRDYKGMILFKKMAIQRVVSVPMLDEGKLGVKVGSDVLDVDQRIFTITPSQFRSADEWQSIVSPTNR